MPIHVEPIETFLAKCASIRERYFVIT